MKNYTGLVHVFNISPRFSVKLAVIPCSETLAACGRSTLGFLSEKAHPLSALPEIVWLCPLKGHAFFFDVIFQIMTFQGRISWFTRPLPVLLVTVAFFRKCSHRPKGITKITRHVHKPPSMMPSDMWHVGHCVSRPFQSSASSSHISGNPERGSSPFLDWSLSRVAIFFFMLSFFFFKASCRSLRKGTHCITTNSL